MGTSLLNTGPGMWVMLGVATAAATLINHRFIQLPARQMIFAIARALVQMVTVALIIAQVSRSWVLTCAFLLLMFAVATLTATQRIRQLAWWVPATAILAGVLPVVGLMLSFGVLPFSALAMIAVVGQLIGGAMSATNLAGRRLHQELEQRGGEVEAGLALGFSLRDARQLVARPVAAEALLPGIDQTRTVGTVTLPGAFVGLVLGGASPLEAGLVQLIVLVNLMVVQGIAVAVTAELIERGTGGRAAPVSTAAR
ncbi:ABC transporter permease [Glutamicibacter sp.]|uniref:ABC transporter permease n=1 Tax=Glutamicibacter sp. TaxID=1931995 RepID=UPI0028BEA853|nr:ABC transporter permease [Glutamicibacter sp.]